MHIAAGTEVVAGAGDDDSLHVIDVIERAKGIAQLGIRFERERVLALGAVQGDGGNFALYFPFEMFGFEIGGFGHDVISAKNINKNI